MSQIDIEAAALDQALARLPEHLREGLRNHVLYGHPTGSFLYFLLANDLVRAVCKADEGSMAALLALAHFLYNDAPTGSWGTEAKVAEWREGGGLAGVLKRQGK